MSKHDSPASGMIIDPEASILNLHDAITERLKKATAVLNAINSDDEDDAIWCVESQLWEAHALAEAMWEKVRDQENVIRDQVMDEVEAAKREAQS
jgi:hypothetical protein